MTLADSLGIPLVASDVSAEANMSHPGMKPATAKVTDLGSGKLEVSVTLDMAGDWFVTLRGKVKGKRFERDLSIPAVAAK